MAKYCFMNSERVCDLTCKAAFQVDDPVDPVDCYFIWLASHMGEGLYDLRKMMELGIAGAPAGFSGLGGTPPGDPPPGPKGDASNN
ncbi:MAG: hypothetical protein GY711_32405 [bacterium]|nr:hypothetical protein [bacterium]